MKLSKIYGTEGAFTMERIRGIDKIVAELLETRHMLLERLLNENEELYKAYIIEKELED